MINISENKEVTILSFTNEPTTSTAASTEPNKPTTSTSTTKQTTTSRTTARQTTTTSVIATAAPGDPHKSTATVVGVVFGVLLVLIIIAASIYTVRRRNIKVPGLETVRGLINPGYQRMADPGMVTNIHNIINNKSNLLNHKLFYLIGESERVGIQGSSSIGFHFSYIARKYT